MSEDLHDNFDDANDEDLDLDRYDSAAGWDGSDADESNTKPTSPTHKDRYAHHRHLPHESMFDIHPANAAMRTEPPLDLVPGLWRTGELALLIGEPGIGKSLLAVQIAESIARGTTENGKRRMENARASPSSNFPFSTFHFPFGPGQPVLLLDLDQTDAQFAERYTCPSPIPGKLPVRYRFSPKLIRPSYRDFDFIPEEFNDSLTKFFQASIDQAIGASGAKVIIIDNLAALTPYARNNSAHIRMLNSLKLTATTRNLSILVVHSSPMRRRPGRPASRLTSPVSCLSHPSSFIPHPFESSAVDSIFSLCPTTYGPEYRYIKLLKTKQTTLDLGLGSLDPGTEVPVFQLGRVSSPVPKLSSLRRRSGREADEVVLSSSSDSSLVTRPSSLVMAAPFLGFEYLGPASESDLTRDYAAEQRAAEAQERSRIKKLQRSSKEILVNGVLDGSYGRYLKGE